MTLKIGIAVALLLAVGYFMFFRNDVSGAGARQLVEHGALLVDVRTSEEFASGHIPGAINVPVQELEQRMQEIGPKDRPVVVYCRSGGRSARAAGLLRSGGYADVHDMGAISRW